MTDSAARGGKLTIDVRNRRVWHNDKLVSLTPKAFAVLQFLVQRQGEIVSKEELLKGVWSGVQVGPQQAKQFVAELRRRLHDSEISNDLIETVRGFGYRFTGSAVDYSNSAKLAPISESRPTLLQNKPLFVGRDADLDLLRQTWSRVCTGSPQIYHLTGDTGIGKTALLDHFVEHEVQPGHAWIFSAACIQQYRSLEPLLPIMTALAELCAHPTNGARALRLVRTHAPLWLLQMPRFIDDDEFERLHRRAQGSSAARMLREFLALISALSDLSPLVIKIEDLQWADDMTVALLELIAQHLKEKRILLLLSSYALETIPTDHPFAALMLRWWLHSRVTQISLGSLTLRDVSQYLQAWDKPIEYATPVFAQTNGHALYLAKLMEHWDEAVAPFDPDRRRRQRNPRYANKVNIPLALRQMVQAEFRRLPASRQALLECASVIGLHFSSACIGAGLNVDIEAAEAACEELARQHLFLIRTGTEIWPDGIRAATYEFRLPLYRLVIAEQITSHRRSVIHVAIARRLQASFGEQEQEIAAALAAHFLESGNRTRALRYLQLACQNFSQNHNPDSTVESLYRAIRLVRELPATPERNEHEVSLRLLLGSALFRLRNLDDMELIGNYATALQLCERCPVSTDQILMRCSLGFHRFAQGDLQKSLAMGQEALADAVNTACDAATASASAFVAINKFFLGDYSQALVHAQIGNTNYDPTELTHNVPFCGPDPRVVSQAYAALAEWMLEVSDGNAREITRSLRTARALAHPHSIAFALYHISMHSALNRKLDATFKQAGATVRYAQTQGFHRLEAAAGVLQAWADACLGRSAGSVYAIERAISALANAGIKASLPWFLGLLADAYHFSGEYGLGLATIDKAINLMRTTGERFPEPELYRLSGNLLLAKGNTAAAEEAWAQALAIAKTHGAETWALHISLNLASLWFEQGHVKKAQRCIASVLRNTGKQRCRVQFPEVRDILMKMNLDLPGIAFSDSKETYSG